MPAIRQISITFSVRRESDGVCPARNSGEWFGRIRSTFPHLRGLKLRASTLIIFSPSSVCLLLVLLVTEIRRRGRPQKPSALQSALGTCHPQWRQNQTWELRTARDSLHQARAKLAQFSSRAAV